MLPELAAWQVAALKGASKLRIDDTLINEAIGIISAVFGEAWLAQACARATGTAIPFRAHPIGELLMPPGDIQILGLLELAVYLKSAATSPVFKDLVDGLRAQYGPTFLQLAFGHRLKRCGALRVEFEPPVRRGRKGDIAFAVGSASFVAECYIPRGKGLSEEAHWLLHQCLELRKGTQTRPCVLAISLKLKGTPTSQQRKTMVRIVREACNAIDANATNGSGSDALYAQTDAAHISVARTMAVGPGAYSLGRQHRDFPETRGEQPFLFGRIGIGERPPAGEALPPERETRDSVAIWLSDEEAAKQSLDRDLEEPLALLGRKLERKLAQTKLSSETGRVLIVSSWVSRELHRATDGVRLDLHRRIFEKHAGVAGVLFVLHTHVRTESGVRRPYYRIESMRGSVGHEFASFAADMKRRELADPVIPVTGVELT